MLMHVCYRPSLKKRQAKKLHQSHPAMMSGYHHLIANVQEKIHPTHRPMKAHPPNVVDMIMMIDHHVRHPKNPDEKANVVQHESHHDQHAIQVATVIAVNLLQRINLVFVTMRVKLFEKQLVIRLMLGIPTVIRHHEIRGEDYQRSHPEVHGKNNEGQVVIDDQPMLDLVRTLQQQQHQPITQHPHPVMAVAAAQRNGIGMMIGIGIVEKRDTGTLNDPLCIINDSSTN